MIDYCALFHLPKTWIINNHVRTMQQQVHDAYKEILSISTRSTQAIDSHYSRSANRQWKGKCICRSEEEERSTYPDEAVMEVQADEAGGDAAVVLEGGSHRLLHQGLRRWAWLVVEADLEAGGYGAGREKRKDDGNRGDEEVATRTRRHLDDQEACSSWFFGWEIIAKNPVRVCGLYSLLVLHWLSFFHMKLKGRLVKQQCEREPECALHKWCHCLGCSFLFSDTMHACHHLCCAWPLAATGWRLKLPCYYGVRHWCVFGHCSSYDLRLGTIGKRICRSPGRK